jgi:hypothetical protein
MASDDGLVEYVTSLIESAFMHPIPESLPRTTSRRNLREKALSSQQKDGQSDISPAQYTLASQREEYRRLLQQQFYIMYCQHRFLKEKRKILILSDEGIQSLLYVATKEGAQTAHLEIGKHIRGIVMFVIPASGYWESEFLAEYGRNNESYYPPRDNNIGLLVRSDIGSGYRALPVRL